MTKRSLIVGFLLAAAFVAVWTTTADRDEPPANYWPAPAFQLTDSSGQPFDSRALQGRVWVVDFFFTRCSGPCPMMTRKLLKVQETLPKELPVTFLSISVDPDYDTPPVLADYAESWGIDTSRWRLLTGQGEKVFKLAREGFYVAAQKTAPEGQVPEPDQIVHGTYFLLVDAGGNVRGIYDASQADSEHLLSKAIRRLARKAPSPGGDR